MKKTIEQIKNYIQLHTAEMEDERYIILMREIAEWATNQADLTEFRGDNSIVYPIDE